MTTAIFALAALWTSILGAGAPEAPAPVPAVSPTTPQALADQGLIDDLVVDPSSHPKKLVAWDAQSGTGFVLEKPPGWAVIAKFKGPKSSQVALSPGGSRAYLTELNRAVEIHQPDGTRETLDIGHPLGHMAWLDDRRLAVSPTNGDHLVEIWDVESGKLLEQLGSVPVISTAPGYRPLRATDLTWDSDRHRLHALDAFTGQYRVYDLSKPTGDPPAEPLYKAQIEDPARARYEDWIAATNRQLVARQQYQGATFWRFSSALDAHGDAWMVERCDPAGDEAKTSAGTAHLLAVDPQGAEHRFDLKTACCSLRAVPWGDRLVFSRSATPGRAGCFATEPRPSLESSVGASSWLEATPLSLREDPRSRQRTYPPALRQRFAPGADPTASAAQLTKMAPGSALVCIGGEGRAVDCGQLWLDSHADLAAKLKLEDDASRTGRSATGRITLGGTSVAGAALSVVPTKLRTTRLVTLPLAWAKGAEKPVREVATGGDGRFTLPRLAPGQYRLLVRLPGGRMDQDTTFTVTAPRGAGTPEPLALGDLDYPVGLRLEVVVTDPDGQPIPGAQAGAAQPLPAGTEGPGARTLFAADVGEDGRAVLDGLTPDLPVVVTCRALGYALWRQRFDVPPASVDCRVDPLSRIAGRLVNDDGEPLAEGRVTLTGGSGFDSDAVETAVVGAEDEGRFNFEGIEPAHFQLTAASQGRAAKSLSLSLEAGETRDLGDLVLEAGAQWMSRVIDGSDHQPDPVPVPGATLTAFTPPGSLRPATTDARGEAELEGPATGALTLDVQAPGFAPRRVEVPESVRTLDAPPYEITLERGGWIQARVWDEASGNPCAGCTIDLSGTGPAQSLTTDSSGTARSQALAPGIWQASLDRVRGYGTMVTRSGGDDVRTVTVAPETTTEVRFGERKETLEVIVSPPPPEPGAWRLLVRDLAGSSRVFSLDASGSATVRRPEGGAVLSLLGAGMSIELGRLSEDADDPTLIERPTGAVTGRLPSSLSNGEPSEEPIRLEVVNLATGSRVAEVDARPGAEIRVPFLLDGVYGLEADGKTLATAAVSGGRETDLGDLK